MGYPVRGHDPNDETQNATPQLKLDAILRELYSIFDMTEANNNSLSLITDRLLGPQPTTADAESVGKFSDNVIDQINSHLQKIKSQLQRTRGAISRLEEL